MIDNKMIGVQYKDFLLFPEYTNYTWENYDSLSMRTGKVVIGGYREPDKIGVYCTYNGEYQHRSKTHLTTSEIADGVKVHDNEIRVFTVNGMRILPLICYELLFPEDYYHILDLDLITHHVGYPMYDRHQYTAWTAMQKAAVHHFGCPLVSSCGGDHSDPMILNNIIESYKMTKDELR